MWTDETKKEKKKKKSKRCLHSQERARCVKKAVCHMQHGGLLEITVVNKESLLGVWVERAVGEGGGSRGKRKSCLGLRGRGAGLCKNRVEL